MAVASKLLCRALAIATHGSLLPGRQGQHMHLLAPHPRTRAAPARVLARGHSTTMRPAACACCQQVAHAHRIVQHQEVSSTETPAATPHTGAHGLRDSQMLQAGASDAKCFSNSVETVTSAALRSGRFPPVEATNEMLRLCALHNDRPSLHRIVDVLNQAAGGTVTNAETFEQLQACFTYFPDSGHCDTP